MSASTSHVPKNRPILFSAPMVRALLSGAKTQTRRIVKPQPGKFEHAGPGDKPGTFETWWDVMSNGTADGEVHQEGSVVRCPYGVPGDRLWVKETIYYAGDTGPGGRDFAVFGADQALTKLDAWPWKRPCLPSIHCPRGLSRITLEVAGVRVEPLHAITEDDARAEGATPFFTLHPGIGRDQRLTSGERCDDAEHRAGFACLWDEINGDRATWKSNPWVWVVEFKRLPNE